MIVETAICDCGEKLSPDGEIVHCHACTAIFRVKVTRLASSVQSRDHKPAPSWATQNLIDQAET